MEMKLDKMCDWERKKAVYLLQVAEGLNMDTGGFGELNVNNNSGYVYLWLEDVPFTLYMPIHCELEITDVWALWSNPYTGEEIEICLSPNTRYNDLEKWALNLYNMYLEE